MRSVLSSSMIGAAAALLSVAVIAAEPTAGSAVPETPAAAESRQQVPASPAGPGGFGRMGGAPPGQGKHAGMTGHSGHGKMGGRGGHEGHDKRGGHGKMGGHGGGGHGGGHSEKHAQVVRRLDLIEARLAKIEFMLERLLQR